MNEKGDNDCLMWKNDEVWALLNSEDGLVGSGEKFAGDKLSDLRSNTCQPPTSVKERVELSTVGKKTSSPNHKKDGKERGKTKVGIGEEGEPNHDIRIQTERERRKNMSEMLSKLHAFVPQPSPKADQSTIISEAVSYIKTLQNTLQKLEEKKQERQIQVGMKLTSTAPLLMNNAPADFQKWSSPNVVLNICGEEAHISVCCPKKPGLFNFICYVLEKHNIEVVSGQLSSDHYKNMFMIQAHARGGSSLDQSSEAFPVAEIYKQAASEIMLFMGNP